MESPGDVAMESQSIPTGNIYNMSESKIEYLGPKRLVVVRVPLEWHTGEGEKSVEEMFADGFGDDFKHYCFIVVRQECITQIEFEYPKNDCWGWKPQAIVSTISGPDDKDIKEWLDKCK